MDSNAESLVKLEETLIISSKCPSFGERSFVMRGREKIIMTINQNDEWSRLKQNVM